MLNEHRAKILMKLARAASAPPARTRLEPALRHPRHWWLFHHYRRIVCLTGSGIRPIVAAGSNFDAAVMIYNNSTTEFNVNTVVMNNTTVSVEQAVVTQLHYITNDDHN